MSLKDEIEKLVSTERTKLETRDNKHSDYDQQQRDRFVLLCTIVNEIIESVESKFIKSVIEDSLVQISIGRDIESCTEDIFFEIQPNYVIHVDHESGDAGFSVAPGFRIDRTEYLLEDVSEKDMVLPDEQAVSEYLVKEIAKQIAEYRHYEALAEKRNNEQGT